MGVHKVTETFGDDHISGFERKLWDLTWYVMLKYGCPVQFSVFGPAAQHHIDQHIRFFVPTEHERCEEVRAFLWDELKSEVREGELKKFPLAEGLHIEASHVKQGEDGKWYTEEYWWGSKVDILEYSGPNMYLENAVMEPLIKESCEKFMKMLDELRKPKPVH